MDETHPAILRLYSPTKISWR